MDRPIAEICAFIPVGCIALTNGTLKWAAVAFRSDADNFRSSYRHCNFLDRRRQPLAPFSWERFSRYMLAGFVSSRCSCTCTFYCYLEDDISPCPCKYTCDRRSQGKFGWRFASCRLCFLIFSTCLPKCCMLWFSSASCCVQILRRGC